MKAIVLPLAFSLFASLAQGTVIQFDLTGTAGNGYGFKRTAGVHVDLTRSSNAVSDGTFTNPLVDLNTVFGAAAVNEFLPGPLFNIPASRYSRLILR